jgi:hypothetical protein
MHLTGTGARVAFGLCGAGIASGLALLLHQQVWQDLLQYARHKCKALGTVFSDCSRGPFELKPHTHTTT